MNEEISNVLLPCPFCGGENMSLTALEEKDERRYYERTLSCDECNCSFSDHVGWNTYRYLTDSDAAEMVRADLVAMWNRRV